MRMLSVIIILLLMQNIQSHAQEEVQLDIHTIPNKLISNTNAMLVIQYKSKPIQIDNILSSNKDIISVNKDTLRKSGNYVIVDLTILNDGNVTITVIPKFGKIVSKTFQVYKNIDMPSKILMNVSPSSFSYIGPLDGYITIQLVNSKDMPIKAEKDYIIRLSSSNPNVISIDDLTIKKGEYFAIKKFTINGYGETTIHARYNDLVAESKVNVTGPDKAVMKLHIAPNIAPAVKGQVIYAFVQLQDANGNPIYANDDIYVDIRSNIDDIITSPLLIKRGESIGFTKLIINTNKTCNDAKMILNSDNNKACIEFYAMTNEMRSNSSFLELRNATNDNYVQFNKSIDDPTRIIPVLFPTNMQIIADGKEKVIGVIQLMKINGKEFSLTNAQPVIPTHNISIDINSDLLDVNNAIIEKPYSSILLNAKTGYLAGNAKIELFGENLESYTTTLRLYGHENVKMVAEPMLDVITQGINFPYIVYFKDDKDMAAYAFDDFNILISQDKHIALIESKPIKKGDGNVLLDAISLEDGELNVSFEILSHDIKTNSMLKIIKEREIKMELNMEESMVKNTKTLASIELLDTSGFPFLTDNELTISIYNPKFVNTPKEVIIPKNKYYTVFPVEAYDVGKGEIIVFADGFEPLSKSIQVVDDNIKLILSIDKIPTLNDNLTITLNASYNGYPLNNVYVIWENTKGLLLEYDRYTNVSGMANAKYLINEEGEYVFHAIIRDDELERDAKFILNVAKKDEIIPTNMTNEQENTPLEEAQLPQLQLPIDVKYLFIIPAIAAIAFSILRKIRKV